MEAWVRAKMMCIFVSVCVSVCVSVHMLKVA